MESAIDDEGSYEWVIEKPGYYALIVGKQAGYIATSFQISITVIRTKTIATTYTYKINITETFTTLKPLLEL